MLLRLLLIAALGGVVLYLFSPSPARKPQRESMRPEDAAQLLGVSPDADAKTIKAAHRALIKSRHPDSGGSAADAARLNHARDVLLKRVKGA